MIFISQSFVASFSFTVLGNWVTIPKVRNSTELQRGKKIIPLWNSLLQGQPPIRGSWVTTFGKRPCHGQFSLHSRAEAIFILIKAKLVKISSGIVSFHENTAKLQPVDSVVCLDWGTLFSLCLCWNVKRLFFIASLLPYFLVLLCPFVKHSHFLSFVFRRSSLITSTTRAKHFSSHSCRQTLASRPLQASCCLWLKESTALLKLPLCLNFRCITFHSVSGVRLPNPAVHHLFSVGFKAALRHLQSRQKTTSRA